MTVARWLAALLDLLLPPRCLGCDDPLPLDPPARWLCPGCRLRLRPPPLPRCPRCDTPTISPCPVCPRLPVGLAWARSAFVYDGVGRRLVHACKFEGWLGLVDLFAERCAPLLAQWPADALVPVPTSPVRRRARGYGVPERLAAALAQRTGLPVMPLLARPRQRRSQTTLSFAERHANVADAFALAPGVRLPAGARLVLVDDVWTTGATVAVCAARLLKAGARAVGVLTVARALPPGAPKLD